MIKAMFAGCRNKTISVSTRIFAPPKGIVESASTLKVGDGKEEFAPRDFKGSFPSWKRSGLGLGLDQNEASKGYSAGMKEPCPSKF